MTKLPHCIIFVSMKYEKQLILRRALASGRYHVDPEEGKVYSLISGRHELKPLIKHGSKTIHIYAGRLKGHAEYSVQQVVYFFVHGKYKGNIEFIDGDKMNTSISNLRLSSRLSLNAYSKHNTTGLDLRRFNQSEIARIIILHEGGLTNSEVARKMAAHRVSIGRIINKWKAREFFHNAPDLYKFIYDELERQGIEVKNKQTYH